MAEAAAAHRDTALLTFLRENVKAASKVKGPSLAGTRRHASTRVARPAVPRGWGLSLHPHPTAPHLQGWLGHGWVLATLPRDHQREQPCSSGSATRVGRGLGWDPQAGPLRFHPRC